MVVGVSIVFNVVEENGGESRRSGNGSLNKLDVDSGKAGELGGEGRLLELEGDLEGRRVEGQFRSHGRAVACSDAGHLDGAAMKELART